jgi:hypothetical protein
MEMQDGCTVISIKVSRVCNYAKFTFSFSTFFIQNLNTIDLNIAAPNWQGINS